MTIGSFKKTKEKWNILSDLHSFSQGYNFNGLACKLWDHNFLDSSLCFMNKFWWKCICTRTFLLSKNSKTLRIIWDTLGKVYNSYLVFCPQLFSLDIIISLISTSEIWPQGIRELVLIFPIALQPAVRSQEYISDSFINLADENCIV